MDINNDINNDIINIGDYVEILQWTEPNSCNWSNDFNKIFKVIGFTGDFTAKYININNIGLTPMADVPYLIIDKKLSNGKCTIHPIFIKLDKIKNRDIKINKLLK